MQITKQHLLKTTQCNVTTTRKITSPSPKSFGKSASLPLWQITELPVLCATSCTIPTADKSNHSGTGTLHPHSNATCILYVTQRCLIPPPKKNSPFPTTPKVPTGTMEKWKLPIILHMSRWKLSILPSSGSHSCVFLSFFQLLRNHYAEHQILSCAMLHPHCSATCVLHVTLHCPISLSPLAKKICCP